MNDIIILGGVRNHYSFYESLCERFRIAGFLVFPPRLSLRTIKDILTLAKSNKKRKIFIEESCSIRLSMAILIIGLFFRNSFEIRYCIHNANAAIYPPISLSGKKTVYFIFKKLFLYKISLGFIVVSDEIKIYINKAVNINVTVVPFRIPMLIKKTRPDVSVFIIPGNVEDARRNYVQILDVATKILKSGKALQLHFLGIYEEEKVSSSTKECIESFNKNFPSVLFLYKNHIPEDDYMILAGKCTALIANINKYYVTDYGVEIYGVTKETGVRVLADSLGVKCIITSDLPVGKNKSLYYPYSDEDDLLGVMLRLMQSEL